MVKVYYKCRSRGQRSGNDDDDGKIIKSEASIQPGKSITQQESKQALSISLCLSRAILLSREIWDCDMLLLSDVAPT